MGANRQAMNDERNAETGKFAEKYQAEEFVAALRSLGTAGTADIAAEVGAPRRTAYNKLNTLADAGRIRTRKIGNVRVWELADE